MCDLGKLGEVGTGGTFQTEIVVDGQVSKEFRL